MNRMYVILCFDGGLFLGILLFSSKYFFHQAWLIVNNKELVPELMVKCFGGISILMILMIISLIVTLIPLKSVKTNE